MTNGIIRKLTIFCGIAAIAATTVIGAQGGDATIRRTVTVTQTALIAGLPVEKGKYEAEISGGTDQTIVLRRDKKEVARARVQKRDLATPAKYDRVDLRTEENGAKGIATIMFKGDTVSYEVQPDQGVAVASKP